MAALKRLPNYDTRDALLTRLRELKPELELEGIRHLAIFGSVARGDDVPESDVDIIVDVDPARHLGLFQFASVEQYLESKLGRHVDLGSMRSLRRGRHDHILDELVEAF